MSFETDPRLLVVDDKLFDEHHSRGYHPERPERLDAARRAIHRCAAAGVSMVPVHSRDATDDEIARAHEASYIDALGRLDGRTAALDSDTYIAPASVAAARRAAGSAIGLVETIMRGDGPRIGCALLRPPGHHATRDRGMGFCLLNNAAIAAHAALNMGLERVAIVDWDVHHGNGTQDIFWNDPRVLYLSLHQWPFYPGTGAVDEVGGDDGQGFTVNVPLSAGALDAVYEAAFHELVLPVLGHFRPQLVLVSAGFDAHERDPLAQMALTDAAYGRMARALFVLARTTADGRLALLLEGGYDLGAIEGSLATAIRAMTLPIQAWADVDMESATTPLLNPKHREELTRARRTAAKAWRGL
jgi:acetoin utilization deacetylase AcuC-like enzyme